MSLLRQLYRTSDFADCYGSGVYKSWPPAAERVSKKNTDAIISEANSSLRAARLASSLR